MKTLIGLTLLIGRTSAFTPGSSPRSVSAVLRSVDHYSSLFRNGSRHFANTRINMSTSEGTSPPKKRVLVPIADDSEEIETACITDTLVRFGAEVIVASVKPDGELMCKMSRGLKMVADIPIEDAAGQEWDLVALPGGMPGAAHLRDSAPLVSILKKHKDEGKLYGAVCASPAIALASHGLVEDGATCYPAPGLLEKMPGTPREGDVVVQGNVVTSKGPGTSLKFAIALGELLYGADEAKAIADEMLVA